MTLLGIDISHYQGSPNFAQLKANGLSFVFMKATQGTGYVDPSFVANRSGARAVGLTPGFYHFANNTDPVQEAHQFCATVGSLLPGELVALDWEVAGANPPAWCKTWLDTVQAALGVKPLIYLNQSTANGFNWSPVSGADYGLWLAKYDNTQAVVPTTYWPVEAIKQYSDAGAVAGIAGGVDLDVFEGDAAALARYGFARPAAPAAPPAPALGGEIAVKYNTTPGLAALLGAPSTPETGCPDGVGRFNHFVNDSGSIYWTPAIGAFSVHGGIAQAWAASGWERGPLGYPISDEFGVDGFDRAGKPLSWRQSNFEHGYITWTTAAGAVLHHG